MSKINQHQRAALGWDVLARVAKEKGLIRYGELGNQIGIHHRPIRYVLGYIQDYCLQNQLPPLTILVVNQSGLPGEGFIAWDVDDIDEGLRQVYGFNWENLDNPFGFAKGGLTEHEIIEEMLKNPDNANEIYAKIKVRGAAQPIFRKALLRAYDLKCAFCGFSFEVGLEASHIIPWAAATKSERLDVRNGILLCATHHRLFDERVLTINEDFTIKFNATDKRKRVYAGYDRLLTTTLHGKKMTLPSDNKHRPLTSYVTRHRQGFEK